MQLFLTFPNWISTQLLMFPIPSRYRNGARLWTLRELCAIYGATPWRYTEINYSKARLVILDYEKRSARTTWYYDNRFGGTEVKYKNNNVVLIDIITYYYHIIGDRLGFSRPHRSRTVYTCIGWSWKLWQIFNNIARKIYHRRRINNNEDRQTNIFVHTFPLRSDLSR